MLIIAIHQKKLLIEICDVTSCDESPCECKLFIREMKNTDRVCFTTWATWATGNQSFKFRILHLHLQHGQHEQHGQLAINHLYLEFYIFIYNMGNSINHVSTLFLFVSLCFTKGTSISWAPQLFGIFLSVFNAMGTLGKASIFFMISFLKVAGWSGVQNKIMAK